MSAPLLFVVVKAFTDTKDGKRLYKPGSFYPRKGVELDEERLAVLATSDNDHGEPFIMQVVEYVKPEPAKVEDKEPEVPEKVEDKEPENESPAPEVSGESFPKHTGGGYYELSDGSKVQGKANAEKAEQALQNKE